MTARQVVEQHADAPSADIAARLEAAGALVCEHGRISCATFCGVECSAVRLDDIVTENAAGERDYQSVWEKTGPWKVISLEDRLQWADEIDRLIVRDEARLAARHREVVDAMKRYATEKQPCVRCGRLFTCDCPPESPMDEQGVTPTTLATPLAPRTSKG